MNAYSPIPVETGRASTSQLAELIRPFVGAKLRKNWKPDPNSKFGGYLPRTAVIDIAHGVCRSIDADIRSVTAEGITRAFYCEIEFIPWSEIREIVIASIDRDGNRLSERTVEHVGERRVAA